MKQLDRYRRWADARLTTAEADAMSVVRRDQPDEGPHTVSTPRTQRTPDGTGRIVAGIIGLVVAALAYYAPHAVFAASVSQAHALCSGPAGQVAQVLSATAQDDCARVGNAVTVIVVIAIAGAGMLAWGITTMRRTTT